jgi:hypothetical protein
MTDKKAWSVIFRMGGISFTSVEEEDAFINYLEAQDDILSSLDVWGADNKLKRLLYEFSKPTLPELQLRRLYYRPGTDAYDTDFFIATADKGETVEGLHITWSQLPTLKSVYRIDIPNPEVWCPAPEYVHKDAWWVMQANIRDARNKLAETLAGSRVLRWAIGPAPKKEEKPPVEYPDYIVTVED